jgi:hypothetical protein
MESSWRVAVLPGWARGTLTGEALGTCASANVAVTRKLSAKTSFRRTHRTQHFFCSLTLNLIFLPWLGKPPRTAVSPAKGKGRALQFVPQSLLMPVRLHAFAALVLGNFCFPAFFKRAHSDFQ